MKDLQKDRATGQQAQSRTRAQTNRAQRDPSELERVARDVTYEWDMLRCAAYFIQLGTRSPVDAVTINIALEAFLLHFRNLRAFLCPSLQKTYKDDVIASDFMDSPVGQDVGTPELLGKDKDRIDKLLAHISYKRAQYAENGEKNWHPAAMLPVIQKGMEEFFRRLPPDRRTWFKACMEGECTP